MADFFPTLIESRARLAEICQTHKVRYLFLFGSALSEEFDRDHASDLDFYVEMNVLPPLERGEHLLQLWNELEALFNRPVDLISNTAVQNPYLKRQIEATKVLLYDGSSQEILV